MSPSSGQRPPSPRAISLIGLVAFAPVALMLPVLASVPSGRDVAFILLACTVAAVGCLSQSLSIWTTVAAFTFSGFLRRIIPAADPSQDFAAIMPFLVALPLAVRGITFKKPLNLTLFLLWATVAAGLSLSPLVGGAAWLNLAVPILVAFAVRSLPGALSSLARATVVCAGVAGSYGIVQYVRPFAWDVAWRERSDFVVAGTPGQADFRPFATLPAPATAAMLCAAAILILVFAKELVRLPLVVRAWALASSTILFLLVQVRSAWLALALALVGGAVAIGRGRFRRLAAPLVIASLVLVGTPQGRLVIARAETFTNLDQDYSYQQRLDLLARTTSYLSPFGRGLGSFSAGSRAEVDTSVDNGYLVILGETGVLGLVLLMWVFLSTLRRSKGSDNSFFVMLLVANTAGFYIGGFAGMLLWSFLPMQGPALSTEAADSPPAVSQPEEAAPVRS